MEEVSSELNPKAEDMILKPLDDIDLMLWFAPQMPIFVGTFSSKQSSRCQIPTQIIKDQLKSPSRIR